MQRRLNDVKHFDVVTSFEKCLGSRKLAAVSNDRPMYAIICRCNDALGTLKVVGTNQALDLQRHRRVRLNTIHKRL